MIELFFVFRADFRVIIKFLGMHLTFTNYIISKMLLILLVSSFVYFLAESDGDRPQSNEKVILSNNVNAEPNESNEDQTPANECSESTE